MYKFVLFANYRQFVDSIKIIISVSDEIVTLPVITRKKKSLISDTFNGGDKIYFILF